MKGQVTGELVIWLYRFLLITAISFALVIIIGNRFTSRFDVRTPEATILSEKVVNCIHEAGKSLTQDSLEGCVGMNKANYYIEANASSLQSNYSNFVISGNSDIKVQCDLLRKGKKFQKAPSCSKFSYLILIDSEKAKLDLEIDIGKYAQNL
jgi:hypothetical protein